MKYIDNKTYNCFFKCSLYKFCSHYENKKGIILKNIRGSNCEYFENKNFKKAGD